MTMFDPKYLQRLSQGSLTLDELRQMEDTLLMGMPLAIELELSILGAIEEKREELLHQEISLLEPESCLPETVHRFFLMRDFLSPDEANEELLALAQRAEKERDGALAKRIEELEFLSSYPIVQELDPEGSHSSFASRLLEVAKEVEREGSAEPFVQKLSVAQQRQILQGGGALTPEILFEAIERYLASLQRQAKVALALHVGSPDAFSQWALLPQDVTSRSLGLAWEALGGEDPLLLQEEQGLKMLSAALVMDLEERMGFSEGSF